MAVEPIIHKKIEYIWYECMFLIYYIPMTEPYDFDDRSSSSENDDITIVTNSTLIYDEFRRFQYNENDDDDMSLDMCDLIYEADQHFIDAPKQHGQYYLGNDCVFSILDVAISPRIFFQFEYKDIIEYVREYSIYSTRRRPCKIDVLQLCIVRDTYYIITKTHWIRLIQRHWRKIYQERVRVMNSRKRMCELRHRELTGKFTVDLRRLPDIYGMMSMYHTSSM